TLAKAGASAHMLAQLNTPTSPIVLSRPHPRGAAPRARAPRVARIAWSLVGAAALAAGVWWLAPWRAGQRTTTATAPVSPPPRDTVPRGAAAGPPPHPAR